jgi:hypothetical protein
MEDMDVRSATLGAVEQPTVGILWETRFAICQRMRIGGVDLRRMIRNGEIEARMVHGERAFRENRPRSTALRAHSAAAVSPLVQRAPARATPPPVPPATVPNWAIELFVDKLASAERNHGAMRAQRDALAAQVAALQALVDVQENALDDAQDIIDMQRAKLRRPRWAAVIRRFGKNTGG